jgi:Putative restriction endonuclease
MSEAVASSPVPIEVFLDTDYGHRAELVNGVVYVMTGAAPRHNKVTVNAILALGGAARTLGCELFANDMAIKISEKTVYFPDVAVACNTSDETARTRSNPCLIIEVLSPSTASIDQREKRIAYEQRPRRMHRRAPPPRRRRSVEQGHGPHRRRHQRDMPGHDHRRRSVRRPLTWVTACPRPSTTS